MTNAEQFDRDPINCEAACHEVEQIIAKIRATGIGSGSNLERLTAICESLAAYREQLAECRRLLRDHQSPCPECGFTYWHLPFCPWKKAMGDA
jgi:hypothetical protein